MAGQQAAMESAVQEVASQHLLKLAQEEEMKIDEAINKLDNMGEDDYEVLRQRRLQQLKRQQQLRNEWASLGHGRYTELPNQQAFFEAAKKSPRMVCHFYRPPTQYCQVVDAHFEKLALKHMETRFCKIDAEKSPYLVEKLNVWVMPTIVLIKDGQTVHHLRGFDELGGTQDFSREMLCYVLSTYNVLNYEGGRPSSPTRGSKGVNAVRMAVGGGSVREGLHEREFHDDEEEY